MIVSIVDKNKIGNGGKSVLGAVFRIPVFPPTGAGGKVWSNHLTFR